MSKKKVIEPLSEQQKRIIKKAAPMLNQQVGGDFTKLESHERRQVLLRSAPHARQPSWMWTKDRKLKKKFFVQRYLEFHDQLECEFADRASRVLTEIDEELDLAGNNDIFFNLRCEESNLFFHLNRRAITSRNGLMIVRLPKEVYEVQRRAQLRYRVRGDEGFSIQSESFALWLEDLSILDISSGGIGFQIRFHDAEAANAFSLQGDDRVHFHLDLGVFSFIADAEVRYLKRLEDSEDSTVILRVGLRFVGLPQETVEAIQILVLEKSYIRLRDMFPDT